MKLSIVRALAIAFLGCSCSSTFVCFAQSKVEMVNTSTIESQSPYFLSQWVRLDRDGKVRGNVVSIGNNKSSGIPHARVAITRDGKLVASGETDALGEFALQDVEPGVYSLVAESQMQIAVFGLHVLDTNGDDAAPSSIEVRAFSPAPQRASELLRSQSVPDSTAGSAPEMLKMPAAFSRSSQVLLDSSGALTGRLWNSRTVDQSRTTVLVFQNGAEVSRVRSNEVGQFRFEGLKEGVYGFLAVGPDGIAALGFEAVAEKTARNNGNDELFVSAHSDCCACLNVEVADPCACQPVEICAVETIVETPCEEMITPCGAAPACGCAGGGGYGGFGGFGGGGGGGGGRFGIGGLATLGAIGGLIGVAAAEAANNNVNVISPVGP